ncbi:MAG TPA: hypothetical protein VK921_00965 [Anditalea sp.]|nr:hypothetical protein [Anditalea sp.]
MIIASLLGLLSCSEEEVPDDISLGEEITQGITIDPKVDGEFKHMNIFVYESWPEYEDDYQFDNNAKNNEFFRSEKLVHIDTDIDPAWPKIQLDEGEYLVHMSTPLGSSPTFFTLKKFKVKKDQVTIAKFHINSSVIPGRNYPYIPWP